MGLCYFPPSDIIGVCPATKPRGKQRCVTEDSGGSRHFWPRDYSRQRRRTTQLLCPMHSPAYKIHSRRPIPTFLMRLNQRPTSPTIRGRTLGNQTFPQWGTHLRARTHPPAGRLTPRQTVPVRVRAAAEADLPGLGIGGDANRAIIQIGPQVLIYLLGQGKGRIPPASVSPSTHARSSACLPPHMSTT
jgi:hypothetical protein